MKHSHLALLAIAAFITVAPAAVQLAKASTASHPVVAKATTALPAR